MRVNPQSVKTEEDVSKFISLIRSYKSMRGFHIQFNVVNDEVLREAQAIPERHKNLVVRVAGYSAFFTHLHKDVQDDIINRTQHSL